MYEHTTGICKLLYDWQTLVAGLFALVAGVLAYVAGSQQVAEIKRQNHFLQRSESHRLACMVVSASRILEGILKIVVDNIESIDTSGNSSQQEIGFGGANQIRQRLATPPRYEVIIQLGKLGHEIIDNYFLLCAKIDDFRKPSGVTNAASLHQEIHAIGLIVNFLREELAQEGSKAHGALAQDS